MIKFLKNLVKDNKKTDIEKYLEGSVDIYDLENRIRLMDKGQAPFQIYERNYSRTYMQS